jgi:hypothetical protein
MNKKLILSIILAIIVIYIVCDYGNIKFHNVILYMSILTIIYYIYNSYNKSNNNIDINNYDECKNKQEIKQNVDQETEHKKQNKQVRFNDNIDTILFDNKNNVNQGFHNKSDKIIDINTISNDILKTDNSNNSNNPNSSLNSQISVASTNREQMFLELEAEINRQYATLNIEKFNDVEIPTMNNLIPNSATVKNSDINPVINPNAYKIIPDENLTIWEQYDRATTNNYKQFNGLENLENNYISDAYILGNNKNYGNTSFDNYSLL